MLSASGPFGGHVTRPSDHAEPKKIAFLQCVGSRNKDSGYCSSVCCMYAIKEAVITREHLPAAESAVFYTDIRAQGKDFDLYYERAKKDYGVRFIRSQVSRIAERPQSGNLVVGYIDGDGRPREEEFDLVVLSVGMQPAPETRELAGRLGVTLDRRRVLPDRGVCTARNLAGGRLRLRRLSGSQGHPGNGRPGRRGGGGGIRLPRRGARDAHPDEGVPARTRRDGAGAPDRRLRLPLRDQHRRGRRCPRR